MTRKLLYLIPVALIILNFTPLALMKDEVKFAGNFHTGNPSHWKINYKTSFSGAVDDSEIIGEVPAVRPFSEGANYKGFPIGAFFSKDNTVSTNTSTSTTSILGWSWLWITVDLALVIGSAAAIFLVSRSRQRT